MLLNPVDFSVWLRNVLNPRMSKRSGRNVLGPFFSERSLRNVLSPVVFNWWWLHVVDVINRV
jgi:hypothetical protein